MRGRVSRFPLAFAIVDTGRDHELGVGDAHIGAGGVSRRKRSYASWSCRVCRRASSQRCSNVAATKRWAGSTA